MVSTTATPIRTTCLRLASAGAVAILLTVLAFYLHFNLSSATSIHLFLVVLVALRWGFLEAGILSILSVACLDFFFTEPLFAFYIADSHDWVALLTFEAAALLVSRLSNLATRHAQASEQHQQRLQRLYELSQHILLLDPMGVVEQQLVDLIHANLQVTGVALWTERDQRLCRSGACPITDQQLQSAFHAEAEDATIRLLRSGARPIGVLALFGHALDPASMNAAASLAAVAIERARSFTTEASAEAARQTEQLRSAILDGLAHAFKSPLTSIRVSSSGLLAMNTLSGVEKKLVGIIDRQAAQLSDLTHHLLLTASLDRAGLTIAPEIIDLSPLIQSCTHQIDGRAIELRLAQPQTVHADPRLLRMALALVLDNAVKYSTPGSPLVIDVHQLDSELSIAIRNQGSFIPPEERDKIFQRFYRCSGSSGSISGTGIGLAVVRRIAEAHQGRVSVESDRVHGTAFTITLPNPDRREETWPS